MTNFIRRRPLNILFVPQMCDIDIWGRSFVLKTVAIVLVQLYIVVVYQIYRDSEHL